MTRMIEIPVVRITPERVLTWEIRIAPAACCSATRSILFVKIRSKRLRMNAIAAMTIKWGSLSMQEFLGVVDPFVEYAAHKAAFGKQSGS